MEMWGLSFTPRSTVEGARRQKSVVFLAPEGSLRAELLVGADGFILEAQDQLRLQAIMVPSASIDAGRLGQGIVTVRGAWPASSISIQLSSETEAAQFRECLQAIALSVAQSLHCQAPAGAPSLALRVPDASQRCHQPPSDHGPLLLAGYVIFNMAVDPEELDAADLRGVAGAGAAARAGGSRGAGGSGSPPCFSLHWAELCGPNEYGLVAFHLYCSHHPDARLVLDVPLPRDSRAFALAGSTLKVQGEKLLRSKLPSYQCLTFRTEEEARAWADVGMAAHSGKRPSKQAVQRLEALRSDLERRAGRPALSDTFTLATGAATTPQALPPNPTEQLVLLAEERKRFREEVREACRQCQLLANDSQILHNMSASDSVILS
mmetsp:Transcript_1527/g.4658  ORF Transcript_1527/g.4658 Transcript_1527/m.4658 type:complete len:378 (+) Transcript_1527:231-1364(+)